MARKKKGKRPAGGRTRGKTRASEEKLQGPPPREVMLIRSDQERRAAERLAGYTESSPELTAGDVDADWRRAASAGEESPGGTVATPDQDRVDDIGKALGVPRSPDEEFRTSGEILESRDRNRWDDEETPGR
ncbi:MAG: DUF6335 family protein [Candidatus Rokuibacteriota bacterium]